LEGGGWAGGGASQEKMQLIILRHTSVTVRIERYRQLKFEFESQRVNHLTESSVEQEMQNKLSSPDKLSFFGAMVVRDCRDKGISSIQCLFAKKVKAPALQQLMEKMSELTLSQQEATKMALVDAIDGAMHDLLFALNCEERIVITVDGTDIREVSDGWQGDYFNWIEDFSEYPDWPILNLMH
jgi:hypothetical protein